MHRSINQMLKILGHNFKTLFFYTCATKKMYITSSTRLSIIIIIIIIFSCLPIQITIPVFDNILHEI